MRWVRTNVRRGAWCALIALAIQLAVSFGHFHFVGNGSSAAGTLASVFSAAAPSAAGSDVPAVPANPGEPGFDYCAVCAVINLAGSMMSAAAPALPVVVAFQSIQFRPGPDGGAPVSPRHVFKARAPPVA